VEREHGDVVVANCLNVLPDHLYYLFAPEASADRRDRSLSLQPGRGGYFDDETCRLEPIERRGDDSAAFCTAS
jgi:hypothetical protein